MSAKASIDPITQARIHAERALIEQAATDSDFRTLLTSNPHAALKELLGVDPIPSHTIKVVEEQPGEIVLVLPRAIGQDELPDELLDLAAGGADGWRDEWGNTWKWDKTGHAYHTDVCGVEHHTAFSK